MDSKHALAQHPPVVRRRRVAHWLALTALGALALIYRHTFDVHSSAPAVGCRMSGMKEDPEKVWNRIVPSANLSWTPCYEGKECAKLAVPLDYSDPSGPQAAIAMLKIPSKIPHGQEGYRGPILFNPGGPGGSGIDQVNRRGAQLQVILGEDYDLIGFDPRGIGRTEPKIQLFSDPAEKAAWDLRHEAAQPLNATPDALARDVARWSVFGDLVAERLAHPAQYVSTAFVARDMVRMAEAHGESRVRYWGFSYGSVLGITFAAMFPDKVERLIVDGVCDTDNYYETQWSNNLRDTDAGLRLFYEACAAAGPDACALHMPTADEVQTRTQHIFAGLKQRPIAVVAPVNTTSAQLEYGLVDYKMARSLVFTFLYGPYSNTPRAVNATVLATVLAGVEARNGRPLWDVNKATLTELKCGCDKSDTPVNMIGRETGLAVACSDGDVVEDSIDELQAQYEGMAKFSDFAELWGMRVSCSGWKIRAKERFRGPFVGNTSFPIMLIGNSADPVTPLWNARKMAGGFKGAAVLHQKSGGHCSLSAASLCTAKTVRDYFRHGVLPEEGKECEIESRMFGAPVEALGLSEEDTKLRDAIWELSRDFEPPMMHM